MKLFAIKACKKLQDILGKKQLTSTSPLKDIKGIGDKHLYKDMLLSNWSISLPPMRMNEQIQQAYSLVSSMKLDHYKIIKEALSEKTHHRAVIGSWIDEPVIINVISTESQMDTVTTKVSSAMKFNQYSSSGSTPRSPEISTRSLDQ
jgi:hypothetical protein